MSENNYGGGSQEASDDCILYELLVYSEWKQDPELLVTCFTIRAALKLRLGFCGNSGDSPVTDEYTFGSSYCWGKRDENTVVSLEKGRILCC
jgi:hypothetical protein